MNKPQYWPALDGLRGIAILLVIPHNLNAFNGASTWGYLPAVVSHMGWIGVQIFFVLSGFLITNQLLDNVGSQNYFSSFYMRRMLRIFPLYFLALIAVLVIAPRLFEFAPQALATFPQQPWLWLFLNNWTQPFHGAVFLFPHFWSLAVEEQFYLLWPLVVLAFPRQRGLLWACAAVSAFALVARALCIYLQLPENAPYMFTVCRMDALAIGAAAAVVLREHEQVLRNGRFATKLWIAAAMSLVVGALLTHAYDVNSLGNALAGYPLLAAIAAAFILVCAKKRGQLLPDATHALLCLAPLRSVGRYSYAMYVIHMPLLILAGPQIKHLLASLGLGRSFWYVGTFILITYACGMASWFLFERHFLALRTHFAPRRDATHTLPN